MFKITIYTYLYCTCLRLRFFNKELVPAQTFNSDLYQPFDVMENNQLYLITVRNLLYLKERRCLSLNGSGTAKKKPTTKESKKRKRKMHKSNLLKCNTTGVKDRKQNKNKL